MGFSRQEYWSGLPFPSPGDLPDPGDWIQVSHIVRRRVTVWATREVHITRCVLQLINKLKWLSPSFLHHVPQVPIKTSFLFPKTRWIRLGYWWSHPMTPSCTRLLLVSPRLISGSLFMDWVVCLPFRSLDILRLVESLEPSKMSAGQASTLPPCCTALGIRALSRQLTCRELSQAEQQDVKWEPSSLSRGTDAPWGSMHNST